jgi:hypothetical protein
MVWSKWGVWDHRDGRCRCIRPGMGLVGFSHFVGGRPSHRLGG